MHSKTDLFWPGLAPAEWSRQSDDDVIIVLPTSVEKALNRGVGSLGFPCICQSLSRHIYWNGAVWFGISILIADLVVQAVSHPGSSPQTQLAYWEFAQLVWPSVNAWRGTFSLLVSFWAPGIRPCTRISRPWSALTSIEVVQRCWVIILPLAQSPQASHSRRQSPLVLTRLDLLAVPLICTFPFSPLALLLLYC